MSVLLQSRFCRIPLALLGVKRPLGYLGFRRVSNDTNSIESEQAKRVAEIVRNFKEMESLNQGRYISPQPSRRSSVRFVYAAPTSSELGKEVLLDRWDECLYD